MSLKTGRFPKKWRDSIPALVLLLVCFVVWQIMVDFFKIPLWLIPSPAAIAKAFWHTRDLLWTHTLTTIMETTTGFILSIIFGLVAGVVMVFSPMVKRLFYPLLIVLSQSPACILEKIAVPFSRPRDPDILLSSEAIGVKKHLLDLLHKNQTRS